MELLSALLVFLAILAAIVALVGMGIAAFISAGYYLTFPALALLTAIAAAIWGVVYYRAPYARFMTKEGYRSWDTRQPRSEILFRGYILAGLLAVMWGIAFFSGWSGTGAFLDSISNFFIRSGS